MKEAGEGWALRFEQARDIHTPSSVLDGLAQDSSLKVRWAVVRNPHTAIATLAALALDAEPYIAMRVAEHERTPLEALEGLTRHPDPRVRLAVIRNPVTPAELLSLLLEDEREDVRYAVAQEHLMVQDPVLRFVPTGAKRPAYTRMPRRTARLASSHLERLARDAFECVRRAVAEHPQATPEVLIHFGVESQFEIASLLVGHPNTPSTVLLELYERFDERIRGRVLHHQNCPLEVLEEMLSDRDKHIWHIAFKHPSLNAEHLIKAYWLANRKKRLILLHHRLCPVALLELHANDPEKRFVQAVLEHPNATEEIREKARLCLALEHGL